MTITVLDQLHADAIVEFDQARIDDPQYRMTRDDMDVTYIDSRILGSFLEKEALNGWARAVLMDELQTRAWKINPRGVVTEIAFGPDGFRTRVRQESGELTPEESYAIECGNPWT